MKDMSDILEIPSSKSFYTTKIYKKSDQYEYSYGRLV